MFESHLRRLYSTWTFRAVTDVPTESITDDHQPQENYEQSDELGRSMKKGMCT